MIHSFKLTYKHSKFLNEERKDPITHDNLQINDEIVFCAECKSAYLKDTWLFKNEECCNQKSTLLKFPISKPINIATKARVRATTEKKFLEELEIKGYFLYVLISFHIIFTIVIGVLFTNTQPVIPAIYHILYIVVFAVLTFFVCYKEVKSSEPLEIIVFYSFMMVITLTASILHSQVMLIDILSEKKSNQYTIECVETDKIYNKKNGGNTVSLKRSEPSLFSISHDINDEERRMIESSSCTCVELKLYKSSTGIYYIKNRDGGIVKECEE